LNETDHLIFISYSTYDLEVAKRVSSFLEGANIPCWVAYRDEQPGEYFEPAILIAISRAQCVIVLMSQRAYQSQHVAIEVSHAFKLKRRIIPVRLDDFDDPNHRLTYYLQHVQWIKATYGFDNSYLDRLLAAVQSYTGVTSSNKQSGSTEKAQQPEPSTSWKSNAAPHQNARNSETIRQEGNPGISAQQLRKAADEGNPESAYQLGLAYRYGHGVVRNDAESIYWIRKAARLGWAAAQGTWGHMLLSGQAGPKNPTEAALWLERASQAGQIEAKYQLGMLHLNGNGVPRNASLALNYVRAAAESGNVGAQYQLACMLSKGQGGLADPVEALEWAKKATAQGHEQAKELVSRLIQFIPSEHNPK
jgi:hypothetical protein